MGAKDDAAEALRPLYEGAGLKPNAARKAASTAVDAIVRATADEVMEQGKEQAAKPVPEKGRGVTSLARGEVSPAARAAMFHGRQT